MDIVLWPGQRTMSMVLLCLYGTSNDLGDILNLQPLLGLYTFDAILKHRDTEGAGGSQDFSLGLQRFFHTGLVDTLPDLLLHPGPATTTTTAEALIAMAAHLCHTIAIQYGEHATRLVVHIVVATDVAGIVVGELALIEAFGEFDLLIGNEPVDENCVVHYFIVATKLRILVLDGVEAVRAGRDDRAMAGRYTGHPITESVPIVSAVLVSCIEAVAVQYFDILLRHHLPQVLVPDAPGGIACAGFFRAENCKIHPGSEQHFRNSGCHLLIPFIEGAHTTDPVEYISIRILRHKRYTQPGSPFSTLVIADLPWVVVALHVVEE